MDLSLLPSPVSEYNKQRAGALFTVRSANSPSYSLTRRPGIRKPRGFLGEDRGSSQEIGKIQRYGVPTGAYSSVSQEDAGYQARIWRISSVLSQREEKNKLGHKNMTKLEQNETAEKTNTKFGTDRSGRFASENRGRTELRGYNLPSRSRSLDWKTGERSPDRVRRADMFISSTKLTGDVSRLAGGSDDRTGAFSARGKVRSSTQAYYNPAGTNNMIQERSPVSHMGQALDRTSRGHSLPSRLRSQSGPCSNERTISASFGSKGGQSILERIEKLYGSAGFGVMEDSFVPPQPRACNWTSGGTFPRRLSWGQTSSLSPVQNRSSFTWTQTNNSDPLLSLSRNREKLLLGQLQGPIQSINSNRGLCDIGTMSLDRARSKCTAAARIRAARAAGEVTALPQANTSLDERSSVSFKDWSRLRERRLSGSPDWSRVNHKEEKSDNVTHELLRERTGWLNKQETEDKAKAGCSVSADEDVFESNSMKTTERKKYSENSAASVRNKISQFEALSQRSQGLATGQVIMPRRAFSVPTQLSGERKSGSTKVLRDKWGGLKEGGVKSEERAEKKLGSERSLSVDEVGLRLGRKEKEREDLNKNEGKETDKCNNYAEGFEKYRVKSTLKIPIEGGNQTVHTKFYIDESDFPKFSSPKETSEEPPSVLLSSSCDTPHGVQKIPTMVVTSSDSDDDKTPTNAPQHLPFLSPTTNPENSIPVAESENETITLPVQEVQIPEADDPPLLHLTTTSSHSSPPDPSLPDVNEVFPKGKNQVLDLDAWVAGLNPTINVWNDEDDYEDDDDDESTQKDEDSNYDSDSGESSVTITSNMSQSDRKSFCVSLSDLCNFAGVDYESENDSDEWQSLGRRSASLSSDMSALSYVSVMPTEELDKLLEDVRSLGDSTLQDYNDVQVVVLHKEVGVGLGFSLAGGTDQNKPVTVHKVFHLGVAAQEGSIQEGDQVLSINGTALGGYAHWEAVRVLRRAKVRDLGVVVLRRAGISSVNKGKAQTKHQVLSETQVTQTGQLVCVRLEKNSRDLGFSLEGGVGSSHEDKPLTVQKIFQGGPVDKVCPGDEVVEIEGVSMVGMRRLEAWTFIRRLPPGPVNVVLRQHQET